MYTEHTHKLSLTYRSTGGPLRTGQKTDRGFRAPMLRSLGMHEPGDAPTDIIGFGSLGQVLFLGQLPTT